MITGQYAVIRTAEPEDAGVLHEFYDPARPRASLLDQRRELIVPTLEELREVMSQKEVTRGIFHAVEDPEGVLRGFCSLRSFNPELACGEVVMMLLDDAAFASALAAETLDFLLGQAFTRLKLHKVLANCLDSETALRGFLAGHGFMSDGVQRDVVFTLGGWHDLETLSLFRAAYASRSGGSSH